MSEETKTITIPEDVYTKIEEKIKESGHESVGEYVVKVLKENLGMDDGLSDDDEEKVKARLRALGYMD
jgi:predicted CopG family antitoxin